MFGVIWAIVALNRIQHEVEDLDEDLRGPTPVPIIVLEPDPGVANTTQWTISMIGLQPESTACTHRADVFGTAHTFNFAYKHEDTTTTPPTITNHTERIKKLSIDITSTTYGTRKLVIEKKRVGTQEELDWSISGCATLTKCTSDTCSGGGISPELIGTFSNLSVDFENPSALTPTELVGASMGATP